MERKKVQSFEDLLVWQKGIELAKDIYEITRSSGLKRDYGMCDQLQRAAISIPTNIAEGFERASRKEYVHFLTIAKGSAGEVRSLLYVACEVKHISAEQHQAHRSQALEDSRYLAKQIRALKGTAA